MLEKTLNRASPEAFSTSKSILLGKWKLKKVFKYHKQNFKMDTKMSATQEKPLDEFELRSVRGFAATFWAL